MFVERKKLLYLDIGYWDIGQGSKVIRQWPMNLYAPPMMIHKISLYVDYNTS